MEYRVNTDSSKVSEKINEAYSNLESMRLAINNLKKSSGDINVRSPRHIGDSNNNSRANLHEVPEKLNKQSLLRPSSQIAHSSSTKFISNPTERSNIPNSNNNYNSFNTNNNALSNSIKKTNNYMSTNSSAVNLRSHNVSSHNVINQYTSQSIYNI